MYITLESDYAIRIMSCLCKSDVLLSSDKISGETKITKRYCFKILRKLVHSNLVKSLKGANGGYMANKDANKISLKDIICIIEGDISISKCLNGSYVCEYCDMQNCKIRHSFDKVSKIIYKEFSNTYISDII